MIRRKLTDSRPEAAEVNITPLLDIVFILLIFFIVTASFLNESGFGLHAPSKTPPDDNSRPPPTLLLTLQRDGFVRVNDTRLIDPRSVKPVVEEFSARQPRGVVLVSAAPDAKAAATVLVLDQARQAGAEPAISLQQERAPARPGNG